MLLLKNDVFWLVVSAHLKNISQNGNLPQIGVKIKNLWNHHLVFVELVKVADKFQAVYHMHPMRTADPQHSFLFAQPVLDSHDVALWQSPKLILSNWWPVNQRYPSNPPLATPLGGKKMKTQNLEIPFGICYLSWGILRR